MSERKMRPSSLIARRVEGTHREVERLALRESAAALAQTSGLAPKAGGSIEESGLSAGSASGFEGDRGAGTQNCKRNANMLGREMKCAT